MKDFPVERFSCDENFQEEKGFPCGKHFPIPWVKDFQGGKFLGGKDVHLYYQIVSRPT